MVSQQLAMLDAFEARLAEVCEVTGQTAEEALAAIREQRAQYRKLLQSCEIPD